MKCKIVCRITFSIILVSFFAISVVFFAEPAKMFYIENTIEAQYYELEEFKSLYNSLNYKNAKYKDILYVNNRLKTFIDENKVFFLKDEARFLLAKSYERLGNRPKAIQIYEDILDNSSDNMVKLDALFELVEEMKKSSLSKAIKLAETYEYIVKNYKKTEYYKMLTELYYKANLLSKAGRTIQYYIPEKKDISKYEVILSINWKKYSKEEKRKILSSLFNSRSYSSYTKYAIKYVKEEDLSDSEVEEIGLNIINFASRDDKKNFLKTIKVLPQYVGVTYELESFITLSEANIDSYSSKVRGEYYYRQLKQYNRRGSYNETKARKIYENYLAGEMEVEMVKKNLMIAIRNMLAFKKYDDLTELTEKTEEKLGLTNYFDYIAQDISFWTAYGYMMNEEKTNALKYFEKTIVQIPDTYFAIYAKSYIEDILGDLKVSYNKYISTLKENYEKSTDYRGKLFYSRLLFVMDDNSKKDYWRNEVISLTKKYYPDTFFDLQDSSVNIIKSDLNIYLKFLVFLRSGMTDKAEALLLDLNINDKNLRSVLMLREILKNKNFSAARKYYDVMGTEGFINENFAFFSKELQMIFYPLPYDSEITLALSRLEETQLDKYLVYAVIRGESMYIPKSRSRAGARGLMQLMPSTARLVSRKVKMGKNYNLYDPLDNIILGTAYLNDVIQNHGLLKGLAFYNGGVRPVNKINKNFSPENELELIEIHPYKETRGYVKKILTNYLRYKLLYENRDNILSINESKKKNEKDNSYN
ncbi:MAG: lytic transglycosylase domain-containing protein [Brevinematales bacterium]|nr:lytic transglycosylase domain-containing protein [Brevinematales bacterium]